MTTATPPRPQTPRPPAPRSRPAAAPRGPGIDPFRVVRRHLLVLLAATLFGVGLGVGSFILLARYYPLFEGQVIFEVKPGVPDPADVTSARSLQDDEIIRVAQTQMLIMVSREVLSNSARHPNVAKTRWFQSNFQQGGATLIEEAVDDLEDSLSASVLRGTEAFALTWSTHDKEDVPKVLNAVADAYMAKRKELDDEVYNANLELFKSQLRATDLAIRDLEQETDNFIRDSGITTLQDPRYTDTALTVQSLTNQRTAASQQLSIVTSRYDQTSSKLEGTLLPSSDDVLQAEQDPSVRTHISNIENLQVQMRVVREKYRPDHSAVRELDMRLRAGEAEKEATVAEVIRRNLNGALKALDSERLSLVNLLDHIDEDLEVKSKELSELTAQQSKYEALSSQRAHLEATRDGNRKLIQDIELMRLRTDAERVSVAQRAITPREKSFPKAPIVVPLVTLLVLGATLGLVFMRELSDQRVKTASDLAVLPGARVLGVIPDLAEDPTKCRAAELVVRRFPSSVVAESYRQTFTPIMKAIDHAGHQTLVVIGGLPGSGSTTAVTNLAVAAAASGRRVLAVDANFRRPRLAEVFGIEGDPAGLGDLLAGEGSVDESIVRTESGVDVLLAGRPASRVIERLHTPRLGSLVAELRDRYDLIIFDAPPAIAAGDALVLANKLDAAILIVRANQEQRGLVARLIAQVADTHCDLLGIVLNRPRGTAGGYFKKNFATMAAYTAKSS
jgi:capsular exopolysaccharide synthesis family protein